jgi:hypothetical protein
MNFWGIILKRKFFAVESGITQCNMSAIDDYSEQRPSAKSGFKLK